MKDLRNPLTRTENFEHPSGNIMKELTEAELNSVAAGAGVARNSGGIACTLTDRNKYIHNKSKKFG